MKYFFITAIVFACIFSAVAQNKPVFRSQLDVGISAGDKETGLNLSAVNGFRMAGWYAGLGVGLDQYRYRTVPLFLSVQKNFSKKPSSVYYFLDGGTNFFWDHIDNNSWLERSFDPGWYTATGLGYRLGWKGRREALLLNAGYAFKRIRENRSQTVPCLVPPCPQSNDRYQYDLNTWIFRMGLEF